MRNQFARLLPLLLFLLAAAPCSHAGGDKGTQAVFRLEPEIDCPACEDRIHELLARTRGVQKVDIDVIANRIVVRFDAGQCTAGALIGRIAATGYQAKQIK
ncbi:MAG: heavy-metal-associated domain-containing protein [Verrucomicrobia bacterium]|nr:heavy-metal-associated domain-containing protein [Verrucomicrobiota bacterium]